MEFTLQGDFFLNLHREGLYKFASDFLEKAKQNDLANLLNRCYLSPATNINKIQHIAETLVQIIQDNEYWKQKTYWGLGVPDGISLMQQELKLCSSGTSVVAKIYRVRKIAADRRKSKSIFFLVTGRDERNSLTDDFYKLFSEDWLKTPLFDKIYADWKKPRPQDDKEPLPSQADYKKTRVRF